MRNRILHVLATAALLAIALFSIRGPLQHAQAERAQGADDEAGSPNAPKDKAAYFSHGDMETVWKDLETKQVNSHRLLAGENYVIYVRILKPTSRALVHPAGADVRTARRVPRLRSPGASSSILKNRAKKIQAARPYSGMIHRVLPSKAAPSRRSSPATSYTCHPACRTPLRT